MFKTKIVMYWKQRLIKKILIKNKNKKKKKKNKIKINNAKNYSLNTLDIERNQNSKALLIGINYSWGDYSGYIIYPESAKGEYFNGSEFITDWISEIPTEEEIKFYNYCEEARKYNI